MMKKCLADDDDDRVLQLVAAEKSKSDGARVGKARFARHFYNLTRTLKQGKSHRPLCNQTSKDIHDDAQM
jgi:hypothetical protein